MSLLAQQLIESAVTKVVTEAEDLPRLKFDQTGYWLSPECELHNVDDTTHADWAFDYHAGDHENENGAMEALFSDGWIRVVCERDRGKKTIWACGESLTTEQRRVLEVAAIRQEASLTFDCLLGRHDLESKPGKVLYEPPTEPPVTESANGYRAATDFEDELGAFWVSPAGEMIATEGQPHEAWAADKLNVEWDDNYVSEGPAARELFSRGWLRVVTGSRPLTVWISGGKPNRAQHGVLLDYAIERSARLGLDTHDANGVHRLDNILYEPPVAESADGLRGYLGGTTIRGDLEIKPVADVVGHEGVDHSKFGLRHNRFRWAQGAPDTILWSDRPGNYGHDEEIPLDVSTQGEVVAWFAERGHTITRHRYLDSFETWYDRVCEAVTPSQVFGKPSGLYIRSIGVGERVVAAAVFNKATGNVFLGDYHDAAMNLAAEHGEGVPWRDVRPTRLVDGFYTNCGRFLTRAQACKVAEVSGQVDVDLDSSALDAVELIDVGVRHVTRDFGKREDVLYQPPVSEARRIIEAYASFFWLSPEGELHDVDDWGAHGAWAAKYLGIQTDTDAGRDSEAPSSEDAAKDVLYRRGFQRGAGPHDVLLINGERPLTRPQRATLERLGIEHDLTIRWANAGNEAGAGREEVIYAPPKMEAVTEATYAKIPGGGTATARPPTSSARPSDPVSRD